MSQEHPVNKRLSTHLLAMVTATLAVTGSAYGTQVALTGGCKRAHGTPGTNFGTLSNLYMGNGNAAFLHFDLSMLPAGITAGEISRATLTGFVNRMNSSGAVNYPAASVVDYSSATYLAVQAMVSPRRWSRRE